MISAVIRLYGLLALLDLVLLVTALISCLTADEHEVRNLPKLAWIVLILLFSPIGAVAWFVAGRPHRTATGRGGAWKPGAGFPETDRPRRPAAPDDDPDFLAGLDRRQDEELLSTWEEDLRRREDELRRREHGESDS
jgi:hypothetical protein